MLAITAVLVCACACGVDDPGTFDDVDEYRNFRVSVPAFGEVYADGDGKWKIAEYSGASLTSLGFTVLGVYRGVLFRVLELSVRLATVGVLWSGTVVMTRTDIVVIKFFAFSIVDVDRFGGDDDVISGGGAGRHGRNVGAYDEEAEC